MALNDLPAHVGPLRDLEPAKGHQADPVDDSPQKDDDKPETEARKSLPTNPGPPGRNHCCPLGQHGFARVLFFNLIVRTKN